jgi:hypothetical protein
MESDHMAARSGITYSAADLPYTAVTSEEFLDGSLTAEIKKRIKAVIQEEAPVCEWLLIKRVINSFGIYKAGARIKPEMEAILSMMKLNVQTDKTGRVYWKSTQSPEKYSGFRLFGDYDLTCRDVQYVPDAEIANAAAYICAGKTLSYDDLARQTAALLGYTRMGSNVVQGMKRGIAYAVKTKRISSKSGQYIG